MRLFLDANILVSVLNKEYPVFTYAAKILSLPDHFPHIKLVTSPLCLAITFYFSEKKSGHNMAKQKIKSLIDRIEVADISSSDVKQAIINPSIKDFEDGMEYYAALHAGTNYIITEDPEDFYFSEIPVYRSRDFLMFLRENI